MTYADMYGILKNLVVDKCNNIGSSYKATPSNVTGTVERAGASSPNDTTGSYSMSASQPSLVSESTFYSNLTSFFSNKGIDVTSSTAINSKQISRFITVAADFLAINVYFGRDAVNNTVYYYYKQTNSSITTSPLAYSDLKIEKLDMTNITNQLNYLISSVTKYTNLYSGSFSIASSSSAFIAYFNIGE